MCIEVATPPTTGDFQNSLAVGPLTVPNRVFLAPMSGVTDAPFRRLAAKLGAGVVVSEMIASAALAEGRRDQQRRLNGEGLRLNVVQIAGCEAHWMAEGARIAEASGADIIDINMGCPAKHVTGKESGSALMRDLDHALTLIDATVGAVSVPVTLKMRLGWDDNSRNAPELARRAENAGIRLITVHGRTRCQFYKGCGRLERGARRQAGRIHSGRRQRRRDELRAGRDGAQRIGRGRRDGRARRARAAVVSGTSRALSRNR